MYERIDIIQKALKANKEGIYLEIGVRNGLSFIPIKAHTKMAVDPNFKNLSLFEFKVRSLSLNKIFSIFFCLI